MLDPSETPPGIKIITLTGPFGSGKTTIVKALLERLSRLAILPC